MSLATHTHKIQTDNSITHYQILLLALQHLCHLCCLLYSVDKELYCQFAGDYCLNNLSDTDSGINLDRNNFLSALKALIGVVLLMAAFGKMV